MKACNDIEFLSNYWIEANRIKDNIEKNLHLGVNSLVKTDPKYRFLKTVNNSDMKDWSPKNDSETLKTLGNKLSDMISRGRAKDIKPFLRRILTKGVKKHSQPSYPESEFLGHVHFRWDFKGHTLTKSELNRIKIFFNL